MLIVFLVIGIISLAAGIFIYEKWGAKLWEKDDTWIYCLLNTAGAIVISASIIAAISIGVKYSNHIAIDKKIELYRQQNSNIENQIAAVVSEYMEFESETLEKLKGKSPVALVSLYPELKSDTLVAKQIELYVENNETIKSLECERLQYSVYAWWLFFGGGN